LGTTGSENLTVNSGNVLVILPLTSDSITINNLGGIVNIQVGP